MSKECKSNLSGSLSGWSSHSSICCSCYGWIQQGEANPWCVNGQPQTLPVSPLTNLMGIYKNIKNNPEVYTLENLKCFRFSIYWASVFLFPWVELLSELESMRLANRNYSEDLLMCPFRRLAFISLSLTSELKKNKLSPFLYFSLSKSSA